MNEKESSISSDRARVILTDVGTDSHSFNPMNDYYVVTTEDGAEELWLGGDDRPLVTNRTTMSWLGSGLPKGD